MNIHVIETSAPGALIQLWRGAMQQCVGGDGKYKSWDGGTRILEEQFAYTCRPTRVTTIQISYMNVILNSCTKPSHSMQTYNFTWTILWLIKSGVDSDDASTQRGVTSEECWKSSLLTHRMKSHKHPSVSCHAQYTWQVLAWVIAQEPNNHPP